jgi:hypothetical protein
MSKKPYSFCVLRYAHDPIAGECLNIGVLLVSEQASFLDLRFEHHFERLSDAFRGFEGERFKQVIRHFEAAIEREREAMFHSKQLFVADRNDITADRIVSRIWSDAGLSFRASEPMGGLSDDMPGTLAALFDRFVTSQSQRSPLEMLTDEQVWSTVRPRLAPAVARALRLKKFETNDFSIEFQHAFSNKRWHLVQPLSMDYARSGLIQEKAAREKARFRCISGLSDFRHTLCNPNRP